MNTENKSFTAKEVKDFWQTPKVLFDNLNKEFKFNGDVAASEDNKLCKQYYGEKSNALCNYWFDSNWCNPPYSDIGPWIEKSHQQHLLGKTIVMLVPADTSVRWFKRAIETCNEARFISGRLSFINAEAQKPVSGNNKGSVLLIWRAYCKTPCVMSLVDRDDLMKA
jgi:phage N-6-adenine-methyltransferase